MHGARESLDAFVDRTVRMGGETTACFRFGTITNLDVDALRALLRTPGAYSGGRRSLGLTVQPQAASSS